VLPGFGYSVDLIQTERKSIARTIVVPVWQVTGVVRCIQDVPLSEHYNHFDAAAGLIKALLSEEVDRWMENRSIESMKSDEELCEDADMYGVWG
jgi:hypothetical protein